VVSREILCVSDKLSYTTHISDKYVKDATEGTETMEASSWKGMNWYTPKISTDQISILPIMKRKPMKQSRRPEKTSTRGIWDKKRSNLIGCDISMCT